MTHTKHWKILGKFLFHPGFVLAVSLIASGIFVVVMLPLPRFAGDRRWYLLVYHAPIGVVFVNYLFDRAKHYAEMCLLQWIVETAVVVLALIRAVFSTPNISGHTLFLSYVLVSTPTRLVWWLTAIVLAEVVYIKIAILSDPTWLSGIIVGIVGGVVVWWGKRRLRLP